MYNFSEICRTCALKGTLFPLFTDNITEMLMDLMNLKVVKDDGLPQQICEICSEKLNLVNSFKKQCLDVNEKFNEFLQNLALNSQNIVVESDENVFEKIDNDGSILKEDNAQNNCDKIVKQKNKNRPQICELCGKILSNRRKLTLHMRIHTGVKPYKCQSCERCFTQYTSWRTHLRTHTNERPYQCDYCGRLFKQPNCYRQHVKLKHCNKKEVNANEISHNSGTHLCCYCGNIYNDLIELEQHTIKTHSKKVKHSVNDLNRHCEFCGKHFSNTSYLIIHKREHTGERPYQCDICMKRFVQHNHLKSHLRIHTGERPYECTICKKLFSFASALRTHQRIHTGEKPYECAICNKRFSDCSSFNRHKRQHFK